MLPKFFKLITDSQYNVIEGKQILKLMIEHDITREEFAMFCGKEYKHICGLLSSKSNRYKKNDGTGKLYENSLLLLIKLKKEKKLEAEEKQKVKQLAVDEKIMEIDGVPMAINHNEVQKAETKSKIMEALTKTTNIDQIVLETKLSKVTVYKYFNEDKDLKQVLKDKNNAIVGEILDRTTELALGRMRKLDENGNIIGYDDIYPDDKARKDALKYIKSDFKDTAEDGSGNKSPVFSFNLLSNNKDSLKDVTKSSQDGLIIQDG